MDSSARTNHRPLSTNLTTDIGSTSGKRLPTENKLTTITQKRRLLDENVSRFDDVCYPCSQILPKIISYSIKDKNRDSRVADLTWSNATCGLCKLLKSIRPALKNSESLLLEAFSARDLFPNTFTGRASEYLGTQESVFFGVRPPLYSKNDADEYRKAGFMALYHQDSNPCREVRARLVPEQVSYQQLKDCISFCKRNHGRICKPDKSSPGPQTLFDCYKRVLVRAVSGLPYLALSYAWAFSKNVPKLGDTPVKHGDLPKVMEDAARLTQKLGERYLWVDQLCLNQNNSREKANQIDKMAEIYGGAIATIISAAHDQDARLNNDEDAGLAGVNGTIRTRQETVLTKGVQLVSTLKDPLATAKASYWNSRIWTFQEGIFPGRRLFFTKEQAYFDCNGMQCRESMYFPLEKLHRANQTRFSGRKGDFQLYGSRKRRWLFEFWEHVEQYSGRKFTFEADSFIAFEKFTRISESLTNIICCLWGLPFVSDNALESFAHGLTWVHEAIGKNESIDRKPQFPSYSFIGWKGKAILPTRKPRSGEGLEKFHVIDVTIQVTSFDDMSWGVKDISEFRLPAGVSQQSLQLRIQARVLQPLFWFKAEMANDVSVLHFDVMMRISTVENIKCRAQLSEKIGYDGFLNGVRKGGLRCLLLGYVDLSSSTRGRKRSNSHPERPNTQQNSYKYFFMVVKEGPEKTFERIGVLHFRCQQAELSRVLVKETRWFCFESATQLQQRYRNL